jgi:hypothetical protein
MGRAAGPAFLPVVLIHPAGICRAGNEKDSQKKLYKARAEFGQITRRTIDPARKQ